MEKKGVYLYNHCIGGKITTKYHLPIELDITYSFKSKKPSKEVMEERRKKGLCFEYRLPGHQASLYKNKGKYGKKRQLNATNKGPRTQKQEVCVLN